MITHGSKKPLLSVRIKDFKIVTVPCLVLNEMYEDASKLLRNEGAIVKSQRFEHDGNGQNDVWLAASRRAAGRHYSVTVCKTGRVVCDKVCVGWAQYKVCCHTLAVAERVGILAKFLEWLRKNKKTGSTTKMADIGMPKASGQKKKATQK